MFDLTMRRIRAVTRGNRISAAVYPIPNPLNSEEDWLRSTHQDLNNMTKAELRREYYLVEWCLNVEDRPHGWLVQRGERLRALIQTGKPNE